MATKRCGSVVLGTGAPVPTRPDDEVVGVRLHGERARRAPAACKRTLRVLVVDDCRDTAESLSMLLQFWGHDVRVAYSATPVLELTAVDRPDVLLLDLAMPGMDGFELARQLRRRAALDDSLLIAITGYADEAHRRLGLAAGFDRYLVKPVEPSTLEELLRLEKDRRAEERGRRPKRGSRGARSEPQSFQLRQLVFFSRKENP
jgi:DNA-binding response OmpR family regulator